MPSLATVDLSENFLQDPIHDVSEKADEFPNEHAAW